MPRLRSQNTGWVRSPLWDGFWLMGGLWLAPLLWLLAHGHDNPYQSPADGIYLALTLCFWIGHRVGSSYLAYCTTAYRPVLRAQPVRFIVVPLAVAVTVFVVVLLPESVLPIPVLQRLFWLVLLDYVFVSYHFAAQHYGVLSLYRAHGGQARETRLRRLDRIFALGIGGVAVIAAEVIAGRVAYQDVWLDPVLASWWNPSPLTPWWDVYAAEMAWGGSVLVAAAALVLIAPALARRQLPRALYLISITCMVWMAFHISPLLFIMGWTAQHWMAATGLAALAARADPSPGASRWYGFWHRFNRRPWAVVGLLAVLSALLMPLMEVEALAADEPGYGARLAPDLMNWLTQADIVPWLIALGLTTGFVHYLLDRAVYRMSDPQVRRAAHGLFEESQ